MGSEEGPSVTRACPVALQTPRALARPSVPRAPPVLKLRIWGIHWLHSSGFLDSLRRVQYPFRLRVTLKGRGVRGGAVSPVRGSGGFPSHLLTGKKTPLVRVDAEFCLGVFFFFFFCIYG